MGGISYDVHIHRADDWFDSAQDPISREEWEAWVDATPDFEFAKGDDVQFGDRREPIATWTAHPQRASSPVYWYDGRIEADGVDDEVLRRLAVLATDLDARVQGDDGEYYGPDGQVIEE